MSFKTLPDYSQFTAKLNINYTTSPSCVLPSQAWTQALAEIVLPENRCPTKDPGNDGWFSVATILVVILHNNGESFCLIRKLNLLLTTESVK